MSQVSTPIPSPQCQTPVTPIQPYPGPYATYYPMLGQPPVMQNLSNMSPSISSDIERLKKENAGLTKEVLDFKTRSMKDNLLFFGLGECTTADDRHQRIVLQRFWNSLF